MIITDIDDDKIELSVEDVKTLSSFREQILDLGVISKDMVLTVESMLENNVITTNIPLNRYTTQNTTIEYGRTLKVIDDVLKDNAPLKDTFTADDLLRTTNKTIIKFRDLIKELENTQSKLNTDTLEYFEDKEYRIYYDNEDRLCDLRDINIQTIDSVPTYVLSKLFKEEKLNKVLDNLDKDRSFLTLLPSIEDGIIIDGTVNSSIKEYTFKDLLVFASNIGVHISNLKIIEKNIYRELCIYLSDAKELIIYNEDIQAVKKKMKQLKDLQNILNDVNSLLFLDLLTRD